MAFRVPARLADNCGRNPEGAAWLSRLPNILRDVEYRWAVTAHDPFDGAEVGCAWVAPVTAADGGPAVLKLAMPHFEGAHEIEGLRFWDGEPTVKLLQSDEEFGAMLLERCEPGTPLRALPEPAQDVVIADLVQRLWRLPPAPHRFRPLSALTRHWSDETQAKMTRWRDPGLVREGLHLLEELPRTAPRNVLLATDLHAGNVLRAEREPWIVIDPKPFVGDPAFDATLHLFNCRGRLLADPKGMIRRIADLMGLDDERVRLWVFARAAAEPRDDWSAESSALARAMVAEGTMRRR